MDSKIQDLEQKMDHHEEWLTVLDQYRFEGEGSDTSLVIKTNKLERKLNSQEWLIEELKWEIFMLRDDWVLDHAGMCDGDKSQVQYCLNLLTNVYRSFISDDPQYCERIGDSDLKEVCLDNYDKEDYGYREWYDDYFLGLADIPSPVILDKAGLCDQEDLEITKQECIDMLTHVKNAIENSDVNYCNNIREDSTELIAACIAGVSEFEIYGDWYDYYFLGTSDPDIFLPIEESP